MLRRRHFLALEFLAYDTLYLAQLAFLARVDDGNRHTCLAGTACTARAVGIDCRIVGQTVVDHMGEVVYIKTAGGDVGGHEEGEHAVAEFLHHDVALLLAEVAVEGVGIIAVADEAVGNLLCVAASAAEYDGVDIGVVVGNALQGKIFVLGIHHIIYMAHVLGALIASAHNYFLGVVHEALGYLRYLGRHGGREHEHFAVVGHMGEDIVDRIDESHVEHFVGLVEHYGVDAF